MIISHDTHHIIDLYKSQKAVVSNDFEITTLNEQEDIKTWFHRLYIKDKSIMFKEISGELNGKITHVEYSKILPFIDKYIETAYS